MMVGIPASGKSYVSEKIAERKDAVIYSSDIVRKKLDMDPSSDLQNIRLFDIMYDMIREELAKGNDVVLDSTNTYRKYRKPFLQSLNKETEVTGVLLMRQIENCLKANRSRNGSIARESCTDSGVESSASLLSPPQPVDAARQTSRSIVLLTK